MAQREIEKTELKVPEGLKLCINNCGFPGNSATNNMCQKCFKAAGILSCSPLILQNPTTFILSPERSAAGGISDRVSHPGLPDPPAEEASQSSVRQVNRCFSCRKRVGLIGFRCRCGDLFCGDHRYSDKHDCGFDYRAAGKEAIARANPVVKAAKIIRI